MPKSALDEFLGVERQSDAVGNDNDFNIKSVVKRGRFEEDEDDSLEEGSEEIEETEIENDVEDEDIDVEEDGEEAEPDEDSEENDPEEDEEEDSDKADDEGSNELEEAKAEITNLEKRVKDNRTAYLKEHELRLKLEKQLEAERKKPKDDDSWLDDDDKEESDSKEDPETEQLRREVEELKTARENDEKQRRVKEFESQEAKMRTDHSDYDEMREFLEAVYSSNKAIQERFMSMGATAEAVYELGREVQAELDPVGYKEYLKQKLKKKKAEKNKQKKKELNSLGSTSASPKREVTMARKKVSAVESIFGKK